VNLPNKTVAALIVSGLLVGSAGAAYYVKKGGLQEDLNTRAVRLQKVESDMELMQTDLSRIQQCLAAPQPVRLSDGETQVLRDRIANEQTGIQSDLLLIVEDAGYLQKHWSSLNPQQKELVNSVRNNRT
jgi:hypothetical protein